jgi:MFS superfamily sulfate permease-like transporter
MGLTAATCRAARVAVRVQSVHGDRETTGTRSCSACRWSPGARAADPIAAALTTGLVAGLALAALGMLGFGRASRFLSIR